MEAPDKIFVSSDPFAFMGGYYHQPQGEEYIRKDALLEWAKEELGNTSILRSETIETLQKVIDKLNSM